MPNGVIMRESHTKGRDEKSRTSSVNLDCDFQLLLIKKLERLSIYFEVLKSFHQCRSFCSPFEKVLTNPSSIFELELGSLF